MRSDDKMGRQEPMEETSPDAHQSEASSDGLIQFYRTKGTLVAGRDKDKVERIAETVSDLELACEGAFSLMQQTARKDGWRWFASLARACSVFLRKMVIGDRNDPSSRLMDDSVVQRLGIAFNRLRRIPAERRTIEVCQSFSGAMVKMEKLNDETGSPEATGLFPIAPHDLRIAIDWPLPGVAGWVLTPLKDDPWTIAPGELFDLKEKQKLDCNNWLGQQLVMFDQRGITLKEVIRMVATFEGAHSINVSRLLQAEDEKVKGPFKNPERHILDNVTVFGMKYTHIVVIECALYLYEMLTDGGHVEPLAEENWRFRPSVIPLGDADFFSERHKWLGFAGGLILEMGREKRSITHRIRAVGK